MPGCERFAQCGECRAVRLQFLLQRTAAGGAPLAHGQHVMGSAAEGVEGMVKKLFGK